ncbi:hypothetical protein GUB10_02025 [Salegentibacter sp. BLCTC]|uniref:hypothetical protein n=1 Tax=Salegentibacter sp. BLCTC TaxID=2697368 RepID=UPI00187BC1AE|nr:hypothetical protein [Salegentibacter sp. BLCTC]MBE7639098.1 hypothetical protein [Salegentibacter sp. BLCTC]
MSHYPILGVCTTLEEGGNHKDSDYITDLFYKHNDKRISCLSGHVHLLDKATYNVDYYCNGALSGYWWEEGDKKSVAKYWYKETSPGYTFDNGLIENTS